jgi:peptide/nickel transport system permease protein
MTSVVDPILTADPSGGELAATPEGGPRQGRIARRFFRNKAAVAGLVFVVLLLLVAVFASLLAPHDPNEQDLMNTLRGPGDGHPLGTDEYGRDLLSRLIYGARISMQAAIEATLIGAGIGIPLGMIAGMGARRLDSILSRVNDALLVVPGLLFIFTFVAVLGRSLSVILIAIGILSVPTFFRIGRATTQNVRSETYIEASVALGCTRRRIVLHHVLPNILAPLIVRMATAAGAAVTLEASLSFLGLGVTPPTASWGSMLTSGNSNMRVAPYLVYYPGLMIAFTVLAFLMIGDGLRRAMGTTRDAVGGR